MSENRLENRLIEHCAPTLAGMKSASLFRYFYSDEKLAEKEIAEVNNLLNGRGVYVEALLWDDKAALVYTYRLSQLERELEEAAVKKLLVRHGYKSCEVNACIGHLKEKLSHYTCFPHEIGIFLGYPPEDVEGFIQNRGKNCKSCGLWKVYCDVSEKEKMFDKLKKCSQIYLKVFSEGRSLTQMTVCV